MYSTLSQSPTQYVCGILNYVGKCFLFYRTLVFVLNFRNFGLFFFRRQSGLGFTPLTAEFVFLIPLSTNFWQTYIKVVHCIMICTQQIL